MTRCPFCLGFIQKGAYICRHCNRELIPEYLFLYRTVLEKYPEYRDSSDESKEKLEVALKNHHKRYLLVQEQKKAEEEKNITANLEREKKYLEQRQNRRRYIRKKILDSINRPLYKYFLFPLLLILLIGAGFFINSEEFARWQHINSGGKIINVDNFILKNLETINFTTSGDGYKLDESKSPILCEIWLKDSERANRCDKTVTYKNNQNISVIVRYEIYMCQDRKRVSAVMGYAFIVKNEVRDTQELSRSPGDDFSIGYGCNTLRN